jgi:hypothetical protein
VVYALIPLGDTPHKGKSISNGKIESMLMANFKRTKEDLIKLRKKWDNYVRNHVPPEEDDDVEHLGCFSYPNCDIDPLGCKIVMGSDVEPFGHKD